MKKYICTKIVPEEKYYEVYINADSNDADYISTSEEYTQEEFDEIIDEIINLRDNYGKSHELECYQNDMELPIPHSDWGRCHSLKDIKVTLYDTDGCVYDVKF